MAERSVVWTKTAVRQRRLILEFWTVHNTSATYSKKLIKLISSRIKIILKQPESFKLAEYPETREAAMGHFSIFYKVTDKQIIITAFWDNRQDPKNLLKTLKD